MTRLSCEKTDDFLHLHHRPTLGHGSRSVVKKQRANIRSRSTAGGCYVERGMNKKLSYRKQIARQLRIQYVGGIL